MNPIWLISFEMGWNHQLARVLNFWVALFLCVRFRVKYPQRKVYSTSRPLISDIHPYHHPYHRIWPAAERKKNLPCGAHQRFVFSTGSGPSYCDVSLPPGVRPGITNCTLVTLQLEWCWSATSLTVQKSTRTSWWNIENWYVWNLPLFQGSFWLFPIFFGGWGGAISWEVLGTHFLVLVLKRKSFHLFRVRVWHSKLARGQVGFWIT